MRAFGYLLRFYSYLFHLAISLFFLGLAIVSAATSTALHLDPIGLPPEKALLGALALGIVGLFSTILAFTGTFRLLFPLWAAAVVWLMIKGFFLSSLTFTDLTSFKWAVLLTLAGVVAFFGAVWALKPRAKF